MSPQLLLDSVERSVRPIQRRGVFETLRELLGLRPPLLVLPRGHAHLMKIDVRGVPARFLTSSLRLQLTQILGDGKFGFAYAIKGEAATLWYWSEAEEGEFASLLDGRTGDLAPWPESLLRRPVADGVHLFECLNGFEALHFVAQEIVRTRWFATSPTPLTWAMFVRDAGQNPEHFSLPAPCKAAFQQNPPRGWKLSTSRIQPASPSALIAVVAIALLGLLIVTGGSYSVKLASAIASEHAIFEELSRENATTIALQKQINQKIEYLNGFSGTRPPMAQLELMKGIVDSGLLAETSGISLAEWEYRSGRLRLLFSVPPEEFSLGAFLSVLERQPALRDIKLMTDTPPLTVGIQAVVVAASSSETDGPKLAEAGVNASDRR